MRLPIPEVPDYCKNYMEETVFFASVRRTNDKVPG
jgi:hypothetical protein